MKHIKSCVALLAVFLCYTPAFSQTAQKSISFFTQPGIVITIVLILIPILVGLLIFSLRLKKVLDKMKTGKDKEEATRFASYLANLEGDEIDTVLEKKKKAEAFRLANNELSGDLAPLDEKGLINHVNEQTNMGFVATKKKALKRPNIDPQLSNLICWFLVSATFWLLFGTTVGEYLGIKFVVPDADSLSWLSFGRLRPVHTNAVFWGWSSLGMLGLGYYVIPTVSNTKIASLKLGWYTLYLVNAAVLIGSLFLMAGINNAGGEYREYIWPVMGLFALALVLTLINFINTIARRATKEIYVSNWYMVAAVIFAIVITLVAYLPFWQNGLGETISQGYYMHQGVGMWFMLFTLGLVYYFLPQQLNKPIYSYSLGIIAFWSQIFFYTVIGTHHFVFSSIPWWLQTVAIVGSVGMIIPVVAGTTNFLLTFNGSWYKVGTSYTLPFYVVGIVFYFTGSMQGTAEAFRSTNLIWHFTDFTTAHSHITMYGIIAFFLWAFIYAVVPRLTGKEPSFTWVGVHFWLALIGLLFYTIPLMIGATLKGMMWQDAKPFVDSVELMFPYWLWRAIGGTMMWLSHIVFAYNMYQMIRGKEAINIRKEGVEQFKQMQPEAYL